MGVTPAEYLSRVLHTIELQKQFLRTSLNPERRREAEENLATLIERRKELMKRSNPTV